MIIRKAQKADLDAVNAIYLSIHDKEEQGEAVIGWARGVYPIRKTAEDALLRGDLYVELEESTIVASAIINQVQLPEYAACPWTLPATEDEVCVLHTLTVDPNASGRGYGTNFVHFYEETARHMGCRTLRMDTQEKNLAARSLYHHLGYKEAGIVSCSFNNIPGVALVCLEKKL